MDKLISAKVVSGQGRGKRLGFPTANLEISPEQQLPPFGVYAGYIFWGQKKYKAAISCGPAYTFNETKPTLEAFLIDFNGDLYGQPVTLQLVAKLREMEKFGTPEALVEQMHRDCEEALKILK